MSLREKNAEWREVVGNCHGDHYWPRTYPDDRLARIIDNHQFGLLTVALVIIALADTLSDFGIANSIIQRKEIGYLELTTLYWLNVGLGIVVCVTMFLLSETIANVLNNPELAPLIKTLSLAFVVIPHGQQFRALMQKNWLLTKSA